MGLLTVVAALQLQAACGNGDRDDRAAADGERTPTGISARDTLLAALDGGAPNVVLITVDTLRADRLSCYGSRTVATPAFDRLAAEGVRFTNASSTVPFTLPAHSSIMTGTYPPFHGVRENVGYYLGETNVTLAELLRDKGFATAGFVSAFVLDRRWGIGRGFERYHDDFDLSQLAGASLGSVQRDGRQTVAAAVAWLSGRDESEPRAERSPFFLWLHLFDPHDPYTPPEPYRSLHPGRPYDAEVAYADSLVGSFLDELADRGLLESSLLVVTADHGEGLGDHGEAFHGYFVYDSTMRVPFIVRLPGAAFAGTSVDAATSHVDILPTVLDLTAIEIPPQVQGRSLAAELAGSARGDERSTYSESLYPLNHYGWAPLRALRTGQHKLIDSPSPELYAPHSDQDERVDLSQERPRETAALRAELARLVDRIEEGASGDAAEPDLDAQALAQLRALGYVAGRGSAAGRGLDRSRADPKEKIHLHQLIMRAQSRIGRGEDEEAARLLAAALAEDPGLLDAHQMLGNIALELDRPEEALAHFDSALELDDRHTPSLFGRAAAYRLLGRLDEAVVAFERLLAVAGQDSKATLAIADIEMDRGGDERARQVLEAATAAAGAPAVVHNRLGEVLVLAGEIEAAETELQDAIAANPRLAQPHYNLAVLLDERGDLEAARERYEAAIERAPKHFRAQFNLGRLLGRMGLREAQETRYRQAIASNPELAIGYFYLGKLIMDRGGDLEEAERITRDGLAQQPDQPLGWFVLADLLNRQGQTGEATQAASRGQELEAKQTARR